MRWSANEWQTVMVHVPHQSTASPTLVPQDQVYSNCIQLNSVDRVFDINLIMTARMNMSSILTTDLEGSEAVVGESFFLETAPKY